MKNLLDDLDPEELQRILRLMRPFAPGERAAKLRQFADEGQIDGAMLSLLLAYFPGEESTELAIGDRFAKYTITDLLGEGGMGRVYQAWDPDLTRNVALKLIRPDLLGLGDEYRKRGMRPPEEMFREESTALASLQHAGIVSIYERGIAPGPDGAGLPYCAMELVNGDPLRRYCEERRLGADECLELVRQVCAAVGYAHSRKVVHRDLKPGNILIDHDGQPRVLDFGLAVVLDKVRPVDLLSLGVGSPSYLAPEQLSHEFGKVGYATDVYALGVILFELLAKRRPYHADASEPSFRSTVTRSVPPKLGTFHRDFAGEMEEIVATCLAKHAAERYPNANVLQSVLTHCLEKRRLTRLAREMGLKKDGPPPLPQTYPGRSTVQRPVPDEEEATLPFVPGAAATVPAPAKAMAPAPVTANAAPVVDRSAPVPPRPSADPGRAARMKVWFASGSVCLIGTGLIVGNLLINRGDPDSIAKGPLPSFAELLSGSTGTGAPPVAGTTPPSQAKATPPNTTPDPGDPAEAASVESDYLRALDQLQSGNLAAGIATLNAVVSRVPNYKEANMYLGQAYFELGETEESIRCYDEIIEANPLANNAYNFRGQVHLQTGNPAKAAADFSECLKLEPEYTIVYNFRGNAYLQLKEFEKAEADFTSLIEREPGDSVPHELRGRARIGQGKFAEALGDLDTAASINPGDADIYYFRSKANEGLEKKAEASADLAKALKLNPGVVSLHED